MTNAKVVIVEDEFLVALQLEDIMIDGGYEVVATVPDYATASRLDAAPDVALVDVNLRDGPTGPDIAHMLCKRYGTRIIYVTANPGQIAEPVANAVGVIYKPFSRASIEGAVAYALGTCSGTSRPGDLRPLRHMAELQLG